MSTVDNGLYGSTRFTISSTVTAANVYAGLSTRGWKISFMRAAKTNAGRVYVGASSAFTAATAGGFLDAGEALAFDHPRPDTYQIFLYGTDNDEVYVTLIHEMNP